MTINFSFRSDISCWLLLAHFQGDTCPEGVLKVASILKAGSDNYIKYISKGGCSKTYTLMVCKAICLKVLFWESWDCFLHLDRRGILKYLRHFNFSLKSLIKYLLFSSVNQPTSKINDTFPGIIVWAKRLFLRESCKIWADCKTNPHLPGEPEPAQEPLLILFYVQPCISFPCWLFAGQTSNRRLGSNQDSFNFAVSLGNLIVLSQIQALCTEILGNYLYHNRLLLWNTLRYRKDTVYRTLY